MGRHEKPSPPDGYLPQTISDDTWVRLTATESWETTPAAPLSPGSIRWN